MHDLRTQAEKTLNIDAIKTAVEPYLAQAKQYRASVTDRAEGLFETVASDKRVAKVITTAESLTAAWSVSRPCRSASSSRSSSLTGRGTSPAPKKAPAKPAKAATTRPAKKAPAKKAPPRRRAGQEGHHRSQGAGQEDHHQLSLRAPQAASTISLPPSCSSGRGQLAVCFDQCARTIYPGRVAVFNSCTTTPTEVLFWGLLALRLWALIDCLTRKVAAFPAVDKLSKPAWVAMLVLRRVLRQFRAARSRSGRSR